MKGVKPVRPRLLEELHRPSIEADGMLTACNWLNEQNVDFRNGHLAGDVVLYNFGHISKRQIRKVRKVK